MHLHGSLKRIRSLVAVYQTEIDHEGETLDDSLPDIIMHDWITLWHLANVDDLSRNSINEIVAQSLAYGGVN